MRTAMTWSGSHAATRRSGKEAKSRLSQYGYGWFIVNRPRRPNNKKTIIPLWPFWLKCLGVFKTLPPTQVLHKPLYRHASFVSSRRGGDFCAPRHSCESRSTSAAVRWNIELGSLRRGFSDLLGASCGRTPGFGLTSPFCSASNRGGSTAKFRGFPVPGKQF